MHHLSWNKIIKSLLMLLAATLYSCSYRFSNLYVKSPINIKTIAIENVYNTTPVVLSHHILWEQLQKAFEQNGRLRVTNAKIADAYVFAHIFQAQMTQKDSEVLRKSTNTPAEYFTDFTTEPPVLSNFKNFNQAEIISRTFRMTLAIRIEIYDLSKKTLLYQGIYPIDHSLNMLNNSVTQETRYIKVREGIDYQFRLECEKISRQVVGAFLAQFTR